jgi:hypothetical protein
MIGQDPQIAVRYADSLCAPVAQLDRALVSGTRGRRFNSSQARHFYSFIFNQLADFTRRPQCPKRVQVS